MSSPKETYFPEITKEDESCEQCEKTIPANTELFFNENNGEVFCSTGCCERNWADGVEYWKSQGADYDGES